MQVEFNIPLLIAIFIVALAAVPNEDFVSVEFSGQAMSGGGVEKFMGEISLQKPHGTPLNGSGYIANPDNPDTRYAFTISENRLSLTAPGGTEFTEDMSTFANVHSPADFMLQADDELVGGRGEQVIVQEFDGYQVQTLYESGGGQLQVIASAVGEGSYVVHLGNWTIDLGTAVHVSFDTVSFEPQD